MGELTHATPTADDEARTALSKLEEDIRRRTQRTQAIWSDAKRFVPDGFSRARFFWPNSLYIERGEGAHIVDVDGHRYVDCLMGFGVLVLGHAHPVVVQAVADQLPKGTQYGAAVETEGRLAELICRQVPGVERVLFLNTGTEATHAAIRIAVAATGRQRVAKFEGVGTAGATGLPTACSRWGESSSARGRFPAPRAFPGWCRETS
jgi:4-aminobutyrate aminotransferase-like enzyme